MSEKINKLPITDQSILLTPQNIEETVFEGYIVIKGEDFKIRIILADPSSLEDAQFWCEWKLKQLISGYEGTLKKKLQKCSSLASFLEELKYLIESLLVFENDNSTDFDSHILIMKELASIGWDKLMYVNDNLNTIKLFARDDKSRMHILTVMIEDSQLASCRLKFLTDLPISFEPTAKQRGKLTLIYDQFVEMIDTLQAFWDITDELDQHCWILEPEKPSYGCVFRKIALGRNASISVKLNPNQPAEFPECRLIGPENLVAPLKKKLNSGMDFWDNKQSVLTNLKEILDVDFPSPLTVPKEEVVSECGICYSHRLLEEIPECTCDDQRCGQAFHRSCLVEWLRSLPTSRQSFNVIFGECPYCNKGLNIRIRE